MRLYDVQKTQLSVFPHRKKTVQVKREMVCGMSIKQTQDKKKTVFNRDFKVRALGVIGELCSFASNLILDAKFAFRSLPRGTKK